MLVAWSLNVPHSTFIDRYDDIYELSIEYKPGVGKSGSQTGKLKDSVTKYFDEKGNLREDLFHPRIKQLIKTVRSKKSNWSSLVTANDLSLVYVAILCLLLLV